MSESREKSAQEFAETTPEFWSVAVNQGRPAPWAGWVFKFAEAYAAYRMEAGRRDALEEQAKKLEEAADAAEDGMYGGIAAHALRTQAAAIRALESDK